MANFVWWWKEYNNFTGKGKRPFEYWTKKALKFLIEKKEICCLIKGNDELFIIVGE